VVSLGEIQRKNEGLPDVMEDIRPGNPSSQICVVSINQSVGNTGAGIVKIAHSSEKKNVLPAFR
jgi:hypothetical protein